MAVRHLLVVALAAIAGGAAAQNMKPGLWEITHRSQGRGDAGEAMAQMQKQMANMPPEQRKLVQEHMARQGMQMGGAAPGGGMTMKVCMTPEMVQRSEVPSQRADCKTTSQARTGNTIKVAFACTNPPSQGEGEITFTSDQAYQSKMTVNTTVDGKPQQVSMQSSGKWLGADCGSIKPPAAPKKK